VAAGMGSLATVVAVAKLDEGEVQSYQRADNGGLAETACVHSEPYWHRS
jgi:hypothetical protein